ncbi:MAG: PilZ domain-containing protein [Actinobacteria bacterium]|nr:PilZ domain-containing protein [Actinomycetota bacterium]
MSSKRLPRDGRRGSFPRAYVTGSSKDMPHVGQKVEVRTSGRSDHSFSSVVVDQAANGNTVVIVMPDFGERLQVPDGLQMTLGWTSDSGYHRVNVEARPDNSVADCLVVGPVSSIEVIDRRQYLRSVALLKAGLTVSGSDTAIATVVDLCEGGIRCSMKRGDWPSVDERIHSRFQLEDKWIDQAGMVLWRRDHEDICKLGVKFSNVRERDAAVIRRHVFSVQIKAARVEQ